MADANVVKLLAIMMVAVLVLGVAAVPSFAVSGSSGSGSNDNGSDGKDSSGSGSAGDASSSGSSDSKNTDSGSEKSTGSSSVASTPSSGTQPEAGKQGIIDLIAEAFSSAIGAVIPKSSQSSGSGYATGPLDVEMESRLLLTNLGEVKEKSGEFESKNRLYEGTGIFPVAINDESLLAKNVKVKTSLRVRGGISEMRGTIDIALITGEDLKMQFEGTIVKGVSGSIDVDNIDIVVTAATGRFAGLIAAEGDHVLKIRESSGTVGSHATVIITDVSGKDRVQSLQASSQPVALPDTSGPGYPTGPLNMLVPATELLLDKIGQVKEKPGELEIKGRTYEAAGELPVTINGESFVASEIKVAMNLRSKAGASEQQGTIDVDTISGGHITLEYRGSAILNDKQIVSGGTFKTAKTTGQFVGLVAEGTYSMITDGSGNVQVPRADITISTVSGAV